VRKDYQNKKIDTNQPVVPETVSVALTELAGELREGLLALAVGTGLAGDDRDDGSRRERRVRAQGPPRPGAHGELAWLRCRVGDPGWAAGTGEQGEDARPGRFG
jgi:hypothetical protein